jgi:hypothetical protein
VICLVSSQFWEFWVFMARTKGGDVEGKPLNPGPNSLLWSQEIG